MNYLKGKHICMAHEKFSFEKANSCFKDFYIFHFVSSNVDFSRHFSKSKNLFDQVETQIFRPGFLLQQQHVNLNKGVTAQMRIIFLIVFRYVRSQLIKCMNCVSSWMYW